jgi:hypothetical protein
MLRALIGMALLATSVALPASRGPHYGGGRHTYSHGGHYSGGSGSSHRGGHYLSRTGRHHYGCHRC